MNQHRISALGLLALVVGAQNCLANVVGFETVPQGTVFGLPAGHSPGDPVHTEDGISMFVENFFLGDFVGFNRAEVGGLYASEFATNPLELNNIDVRFDFTGLGFTVDRVTIEFMEFGGSDNFSVNGHTLFQLSSLSLLPTDIAPGVVASVVGEQIMLTGIVEEFRIGGQELAIDNITAVPEPATWLLAMVGAAALARRRRHGCTNSN